MDDGKKIIIKFVAQCGEGVHRFLFSASMTPTLLAVMQLKPFKMIVMEAEANSRPWDNPIDSKDDEKASQLRKIQQNSKAGTFFTVTCELLTS